MKSFDFIIIGNSAGGTGAVEAIREITASGTIAIVSEEAYPAYSRPLISKLLTGDRTVDSMLFRSPEFYREHNITLFQNTRAIALNPAKHTVALEDNTEVKYGKLLLATGGEPIAPQVKGNTKEGAFFFQSINDAIAIGKHVTSGMRAVVIGGGLIGISLTDALVKKGLEVTIVELKDRLLNTILDETGSEIVHRVLANRSIDIITGQTVIEVKGKTAVSSVLLENGSELPCDVLAFAIGVSPRTALAKGTKIRVNRGILVDKYMATAEPDVFACGDAAEAYDFVTGENRVIPIWPNAYIGGRTAGLNMAGIKTEYPFSTVMNSLNYFGMAIVTAGIISPGAADVIETLSFRDEDVYKKLLIKDGYITGLEFINDIEKAGMLFGLMRDRVNVSAFKNKLLDDDFGLAYLPDELRHQRLGVINNGTDETATAQKQPALIKR